MTSRAAASLVAAVLVLAACASEVTPSPSAAGPTTPPATTAPASLTIYAASSLKPVLAQVRTAYEAAEPGTSLTISTNSSTALETKIEQGAPVDVFLSADTANPQKLVDKGLAAGGLTKFAGNLLTVIVPAGNPADLQTPADLAKTGIKVIAAADSAPITKYANQLVANLAGQPGYPADFVARYAENVVSKQDNVASVVSQIELGEGDAGIVYLTDATASGKVATVVVPDAANVAATYAGVIVKASANPDAAVAFLAWFSGPAGQAILASFGFVPAS